MSLTKARPRKERGARGGPGVETQSLTGAGRSEGRVHTVRPSRDAQRAVGPRSLEPRAEVRAGRADVAGSACRQRSGPREDRTEAPQEAGAGEQSCGSAALGMAVQRGPWNRV